MVALITFFFLLVRLVRAWGSAREETVGGERGLKGMMGEGELRRREEELSRREVEREEERGVEEWQKRNRTRSTKSENLRRRLERMKTWRKRNWL